MKFINPYWDKVEKIELLQKWIIVHSFLYYKLNESVVTDFMFDNNCRHLMKYKNKYKKSYKNSRYYYCMKNFDGSTGFDIHHNLDTEHYERVEMIAYNLIKMIKR